MVSAKEFFINIIGPKEYHSDILHSHDLCFQRSDESEPFCELFTSSSGKVILRVNSNEYRNGVKILL